jgi:flagellar motor switch protein FliM
MTDILSQDEIEQLLSAISSGDDKQEDFSLWERDRRKVKIYDFKRPDFLTHINLVSLEPVFEDYAREAGQFLTEEFSSNISVHFGYMSQYTFEEFSRSIGNPSFTTKLTMMPLPGKAFVNIEKKAIDQLLNLKYNNLNRKFELTTEILSELESKLVVLHTGLFRQAFSNLLDLRPIIDSIITDPFKLNMYSKNTMCLVVDFEICFHSKENEFIESRMTLCLPKPTIFPLRHGFNIKHIMEKKKDGKALPLDISNIPIPATISFKQKSILNLKDLDGFLQEGNIIELEDTGIELCI